jgi:dTDP-glucose 4,6-dehydratase
MKVLVTGGAGFIGSALCRHLVGDLGLQVLNVDCLTYAADLRSLDAVRNRKTYRFLQADICDGEVIEAAFRAFEPDAVMHLAAESHVDRSITRSHPFIHTNIVGTHALLEAARRYWLGLSSNDQANFRFLHVSTDEVYGSLGPTGTFGEATAYDPSSPYSASKAAADHLVQAWQRTYGLPTLLCNCSNNYGPYQFPEKLVPSTILNAVDGLPIPVYGDGSNVRDWLYVDDHVRALWAVLRHGRPGQKYNVGGRSERSNLAVVRLICAILDGRRPAHAPHADLVAFVTDRPGHDRRYAVDPRKIESDTGWRATESFEEGMARTVDWYLGNRGWWMPLRRGPPAGQSVLALRGAGAIARGPSP